MTSRREFLHWGAAALALPVAGRMGLPLASSTMPGDLAGMQFYKVVFDERFSACRAFAGEAQRLGLPTHAIKADVTDLWFNDLNARWKKGPAAIAGMTQKAALFCLDLLARDQRMRLMFLGEHVQHADGRVEHTLSGPADVLRQAAGLSGTSSHWSNRVANLVSRFPANAADAAPSIVAPLVSSGDARDHLVSWVLAPRAAA